MKQQLKRAFKQAWPGLSAYYKLIANKDSFLYTSGWMQSQKAGFPCRYDGAELPWMNYSVIFFLEKRLRPEHNLFEYGSGYSTLFYARRVGSVTSVEHDRCWYDRIKDQVPENVRLLCVDLDYDGAYCRSIAHCREQYDVVVVDGRDRVNCIRQSLAQLSSGGVILLDDSHRAKYAPGLEHARALGFRMLDFEGLKPTGAGLDQATLLYRAENCLGI